MNNLYRDLAPITEAAWAEIELEATRTFKRHIAGRRVVDVSEPGGPVTAAISTGHLRDVVPAGRRCGGAPARQQAAGAAAGAVHGVAHRHRRRRARLAGLGLGSGQGRRQEAGVRRGPGDLRGLRRRHPSRASATAARTPRWPCPRTPARFPTSSPRRCRSCGWPVSTARTRCCCRPTCTPRSARPPNTAIRSASTSTGWSTATSSGRPAIDGAFVLSTRGGDFDLQLGTDVSIGYLSHDADNVELYLQETLTFLCYTAEASVALTP